MKDPNNGQKLTTIRLGGALGRRFGKTWRFYVASPAEAVRAMCSELEGFAQYLNDPESKTRYKVFVADRPIDPENELRDLSGSKEIRIAPVITGAKSALFTVILGAALIAIAFTPLGMTAGAFTQFGTMAFGVGSSLALAGIASLLSPQSTLSVPSDSPASRPNTSLEPTNTGSVGSAVPLAYGELWVGSVIVSAGTSPADLN